MGPLRNGAQGTRSNAGVVQARGALGPAAAAKAGANLYSNDQPSRPDHRTGPVRILHEEMHGCVVRADLRGSSPEVAAFYPWNCGPGGSLRSRGPGIDPRAIGAVTG